MYKYTYLLSQSYRTDASHVAQNYQSTQHFYNYSQSNPLQTKINQKIASYSSSKNHNQPSGFTQNKNIEGIQMKYKLQGKFGQIKEDKTYNHKEVKNSFDDKIKLIAQKYSHHENLKNYPPSQNKKYNIEDKSFGIENKSYHQYKSQKNNPYITNIKKQFIATKDSQQNILRQKRLNSLHQQKYVPNKNPLKQASINKVPPILYQQQHNINRTRIKSQISNYVESKVSRQHVNGISKKYHYPIQKQTHQIPVTDNKPKYQQGQTVSKLSSLQQKIKTLVGSHVPQ